MAWSSLSTLIYNAFEKSSIYCRNSMACTIRSGCPLDQIKVKFRACIGIKFSRQICRNFNYCLAEQFNVGCTRWFTFSNNLNKVLESVAGYYDILWADLNIEAINDQLLEFQNRCRKLPKGLKEWEAFLVLKAKIDDFSESCPLLEQMSHPARVFI